MINSLPHTWVEDTRQPLFQFEYEGQNYGLFIFSIPMWMELLVFIVGNAILAATISWFLFHSVVRRPKTTTAHVSGFLFALFWIFCPRFLVNSLGVKHKMFLFCSCVITPTTSLFRTTEAIFGFTPDHAKQSASSFALYYGSPMLLVYDAKSQKHVKATLNRVAFHFARFLCFATLTGLFQSLFVLLDSFPSFGGKIPENWYDIDQVLNPRVWARTALFATLFQLYLTTYGEGLIFFTTLATQRQTPMLMDNPMFESRSPSEFWGKRWNSLVHACLKNGVYKPVRFLGGTKELSVLASFVASGLFHEWILPVVFYDTFKDVTLGTTTLFFIWQAALISLEYSFGNWSTVVAVTKHLPPPVRSALVILLGIPLGHWFCAGYVHSSFFQHGHMTLTSILPITKEA